MFHIIFSWMTRTCTRMYVANLSTIYLSMSHIYVYEGKDWIYVYLWWRTSSYAYTVMSYHCIHSYHCTILHARWPIHINTPLLTSSPTAYEWNGPLLQTVHLGADQEVQEGPSDPLHHTLHGRGADNACSTEYLKWMNVSCAGTFVQYGRVSEHLIIVSVWSQHASLCSSHTHIHDD